MELSHLNERGEVRMVYVGDKQPTKREAVAQALVLMKPETFALLKEGALKKGDAVAAARIAGIMAAKRTHELLPLCHPLPLDGAEVELEFLEPDKLRITASVTTLHRTGVEMEALTAASVAALTIYDMCKAVDRGMEISNIRLKKKCGGKSGLFEVE
ncbi:MAG TPA: cyclic pyranopterin monophosphate synthase MoaC [Clostridia bacterium]|nr:cyclic pyranopterin monophosphate synthase MoaC [Clostridia bacterium]HOR13477.1 cyclic pyranopterin monophosphate synthase MoaC [Clostridia bacterium]